MSTTKTKPASDISASSVLNDTDYVLMHDSSGNTKKVSVSQLKSLFVPATATKAETAKALSGTSVTINTGATIAEMKSTLLAKMASDYKGKFGSFLITAPIGNFINNISNDSFVTTGSALEWSCQVVLCNDAASFIILQFDRVLGTSTPRYIALYADNTWQARKITMETV